MVAGSPTGPGGSSSTGCTERRVCTATGSSDSVREDCTRLIVSTGYLDCLAVGCTLAASSSMRMENCHWKSPAGSGCCIRFAGSSCCSCSCSYRCSDLVGSVVVPCWWEATASAHAHDWRPPSLRTRRTRTKVGGRRASS